MPDKLEFIPSLPSTPLGAENETEAPPPPTVAVNVTPSVTLDNVAVKYPPAPPPPP